MTHSFSQHLNALNMPAMIPYPEPYQSAYQQRRLGALGLEWKPTALRLATGPDFTLEPDFQMLPLADLDTLMEPLPEFLDVMEWEPEIEMQSDDNDSEYNVPEGYSTGGEQGTLSSNSSSDSECSAEDGETEDAQSDRLRRSKRKKQKAEVSCYIDFYYRGKKVVVRSLSLTALSFYCFRWRS